MKIIDTKEACLKQLEEMINIFEMEMDCDCYGITRLDDVPYHFILEDYECMGWDYVHGAKRFIEYYFDSIDVPTQGIHAINVTAEFKELKPRHLQLTTGDVIAPVLDIKFIVSDN